MNVDSIQLSRPTARKQEKQQENEMKYYFKMSKIICQQSRKVSLVKISQRNNRYLKISTATLKNYVGLDSKI